VLSLSLKRVILGLGVQPCSLLMFSKPQSFFLLPIRVNTKNLSLLELVVRLTSAVPLLEERDLQKGTYHLSFVRVRLYEWLGYWVKSTNPRFPLLKERDLQKETYRLNFVRVRFCTQNCQLQTSSLIYHPFVNTNLNP
jgi:5-hydroxyisourate hydrolase-like protein (transthyretin family)